MRIAMISTPFVRVLPPRYGGTELIVDYLAAELGRLGHAVTLFATGDSRSSAIVRHLYPTAVWPPNPYDELNHAAWAVGEIIAGDFDVVHAHAAAVLPLARFLDPPVVYTIHHDRDETLCAYYARVSLPVTPVAISDRQRRLLPEIGARYVVHHGVDPVRYRLGDGAAGYVAFLGRLSRCKGPERAIGAARRAAVPLRLAGKPHWEDEAFFTHEIAPRLAEPGIELLGEVDHDAKVELLAGALALLFPIDWEEPFGLVLIEAMLCGTPVIAFRRGSVPEVIDEGVTGFIVRDEDEMAFRIRHLTRDGFDRVRCRARAAERFSAARMTRDYLAIYAAAVASHGLPAIPRESKLTANGNDLSSTQDDAGSQQS